MSSYKRASVSSKVSSHTSTNSRSVRSSKIKAVPRKVVPSKKLPPNPSDPGKSSSTGVISERNYGRPKKETKSDATVKRNPKNGPIDYCKTCGDTIDSRDTKTSQDDGDSDVESTITTNKNYKKEHQHKTPKPVQQYYKNENYRTSAESLNESFSGFKKISLDTIKEVSEIRSQESLSRIFADSSDEIENIDSDSLNAIKEFRRNNYFECHSAKSRMKAKYSATSLKDHKCVYRFYLNERLFPVPLCTDHTKEIRCMECLLPMNLQVGSVDKINGTVQAKVTLGKKTQDAMILLPIKEPLIIHERRKEDKREDDSVFFGLINLDSVGHSVFNPALPGNSLALKYQKGFQELENVQEYSYNYLDKDDVIIV